MDNKLYYLAIIVMIISGGWFCFYVGESNQKGKDVIEYNKQLILQRQKDNAANAITLQETIKYYQNQTKTIIKYKTIKQEVTKYVKDNSDVNVPIPYNWVLLLDSPITDNIPSDDTLLSDESRTVRTDRIVSKTIDNLVKCQNNTDKLIEFQEIVKRNPEIFKIID